MTALFDSPSAGGAATGAAGAGMSDGERAQRLLDDARANHSIRLALEHATQVGGRAGLGLLAGFRNRIAAAEAEILADHVQDNGDNRRGQRLLDDGKTSRAEQRRKAARASAVAANSGLASKLADGDINEEQLDVIANASARTDGDAAIDDDLIDEIGSVPPERGKSIVRHPPQRTPPGIAADVHDLTASRISDIGWLKTSKLKLSTTQSRYDVWWAVPQSPH